MSNQDYNSPIDMYFIGGSLDGQKKTIKYGPYISGASMIKFSNTSRGWDYYRLNDFKGYVICIIDYTLAAIPTVK